MKNQKGIENLLRKFVLNQCNREETEEVIKYFQKTTSSKEFPTVDEVLGLLEHFPEMEETKAEEIYTRIINRKEKQMGKKKPTGYFRKYMAAAIMVGVIIAGFITQQLLFSPSNDTIVPQDEPITLQLEDGTIKIIEAEAPLKVSDSEGNLVGTSNGRQLIYSEVNDSESLEYNTINVPYGKQFELSLADGTRVYLNSGTSFKYPVSFVRGENREVFLTGEAYFEVAKDDYHPFIVNADELKVQVLGTRFNVAAYSEDIQSHVVLVEGSVGMFKEGEEFQENEENILKPGYKGIFHKKEKSFSKKEVATKVYTSWINGELVFRNMTVENILIKLERHYNISIENRNEDFAQETFNANFGKEPVEKVLEYLKTIYNIDFSIEGDHVIIE